MNAKTDSIYKFIEISGSIQINSFNDTGCNYYFGKVFGILTYYNTKTKKDQFLKDFPKLYRQLSFNTHPEKFSIFIDNIIDLYSEQPSLTTDKTESLLWDSAYLYLSKRSIRRLNLLFQYYSNAGVEHSNLEQTNIGRIKFIDKVGYNDWSKQEYRIYYLYAYWNLINYYYVNRDLINSNWDSTLYNFTSLFIKANNKEDYDKAILKLLNKLNDSHGIVDYHIYDDIYGVYGVNANVYKLGDTFIVNNIPVSKWESEFKVGDILVSFNETPVSNIYDSLRNFFPFSNASSEAYTVCKYLLANKTKNYKIKLLRNNQYYEIFPQAYHYRELKNNSDFSIKAKKVKEGGGAIELNKRTAYAHLDYLCEDNFEKATEFISRYEYFVLDLRGYPDDFVFFALCNFLLPQKKPFFQCYYTDINHPGTLKKYHGYMVGGEQTKSYYKGRLRLIVDAKTQSMSEFLCMALQNREHTLTFGSASAGSDGNASSFVFNEEVETFYSGTGILYPDNRSTQIVGVRVDHKIYPTFASILAKEDKALAFTLKYCGNEYDRSSKEK